MTMKKRAPIADDNEVNEVPDDRYRDRPAEAKPLGEELEFFRQYNEVLFRRLEKKMSDLERANRDLKALAETHLLSFENVSDVIYMIDADLRIVSMSPSVERIMGYRPEEFVGRPVMELAEVFSPGDLERAMTDMDRLLRGQPVPSTTYEFVARDGSVRIGEVAASPVVQDGKVVGMTAVARDVTDRRRAEEALKESERQYRELYDFLPIPAYEMDFDANITFVNRAIYEAFGAKEEDFRKGLNAWQRLSAEDVEKSRMNVRRLLQGEPVTRTEYVCRRLDGTLFPAIVTSSILYRQGRPAGLRSVIVDVTEQKRTEEALRESEEKYRTLFAHLQDAIFLTRPDGSIIEANPAACAMFGRSVEEFRTVGRSGVVDENDPRLHAALEERARTGRAHAEITMVRANGEKFLADVTSTVFADMNGQQKASMIVRDVTERRRAEEALQESEKRYRSGLRGPLRGQVPHRSGGPGRSWRPMSLRRTTTAGRATSSGR